MDESVEQIDPTSKLSIEIVKQRAVSGAAILTLRTFLMQAIAFFATALLTIFLEPAQYGVFFLVSAVINFLAYFGDIGFAAALIQKRDKLTQDDLKTIFTAQQVLVLLLIAIVLIGTPVIKNTYHFSLDAVYLLWALTFSLFTSSLKTIPSVLLERRLEFNKLIIPQIVEAIVFYVSAVLLAWKGFGVSSFTIAVILRGVSGLATTYLVSPWVPSFSFSTPAFKSILKFGIPYQANAFLAMIKDDGMTLFLGGILGSSGIGLLGWAQKWAYAPLRFFMDQVIKVTFPAFSRLQDNKKELSNAASKSIFFVCLLVFPSLILLILLAPLLTEIIPKYGKWSPALLALTVIAINSGLAAITTPLTNLLNAIGKISVTFKLMIMWTTLTWIFVPILAILYGVNGAAIGYTLVGLSSIVALFITSKYIDINYLKITAKPLVGSVLMGVIILFLRNLFSASFIEVIALGLTGVVVYTIALFLLEPSLYDTMKGLKFGKSNDKVF